MGRARGQNRAADAFGVFGQRRGSGRDEGYLTELIRSELARGNFSPAIAALAISGALDESNTRQVALRTAIIQTLAAAEAPRWSGVGSHLVALAELQRFRDAETLVYNPKKRVIHIWPNGRQFADIPWRRDTPVQKTACGIVIGLDINQGRWRRAHRGDFATPGNRLKACSKCAKHAPDYEDAQRTRQQADALPGYVAAAHQAELERRLDGLLAERMARGDLDPSENLSALAVAPARAAIIDAVVGAVEDRPGIVLERVFDAGSGYRSVLSQLGLDYFTDEHAFDTLATYITREDWRQLLGRFCPDSPLDPFRLDYDSFRRGVMEAIERNATEPDQATAA